MTSNKLKKKFVASDLLFKTDKSLGLSQWIFHNEKWIRIKRFREWQPLISKGFVPNVVDKKQKLTKEVSFLKNGSIKFNGKTTNDYEWLILFLDLKEYNWGNYTWKFKMRRLSNFGEFQFAFRYQSLYNRYRYRFENNRIYFEKFVKCKAFHNIDSVKFPMKLRKWYNVRIDVYESNFKCYVDGKLMMQNSDNDFKNGSIAIILWEDNGKDDIKAEVGPMTVHKLVSRKK
ncbi:hypothetical protein ACFLUF_02225 [Chloroflexota bacterium]